MRTGLRKHRITIEKPVETKSDSGATKTEWVPLCKVWSSYNPKSATENFAEQQRQDFLISEFTILYRSDVNAKMRIVFCGRVFDLIQPPMDYLGMQKELVLHARERGE